MGSSSDAGKHLPSYQRVRNLDLFRCFAAADDIMFSDLDAGTRARLVEAIAKGDLSGQAKILSMWGVRR